MNFPIVRVEIAFASNPNQVPDWVDVSDFVREIHIRRGRQHELGRFEAGTCTIALDNRDRRFEPEYASSPYYPNVVPMRRVRVSAIWRDSVYRLFTGFVEAWPQTWPGGMDAEARLEASDGFKLLNMYRLDHDWPQEYSGDRVNRVLDTTGLSGVFLGQGYWVLGDSVASQLGITTKLASELEAFRYIERGKSQVQAGHVDDSALAHLQAVAESENGQLFLNGAGQLVFQSRHYRLCNHESRAVFGDAPGELPYRNLVISGDDSWLYNEIELTRNGGEAQIVADDASQNRYGTRVLSRSGLLLISDEETYSAANWLLALYREFQLRISAIEIEPMADPDSWPYVLGLEISDCVTVRRRPQGGEAISRDYYIESIAHDVSYGTWVTRWQLSPVSGQAFWVVGSSQLSVSTRLAY